VSDRPGGLYRRKSIAKFLGPVILGRGWRARRPIGVSVRSFILEKKRQSDGGLADAAPHYHGHRERLRGRFRDAGADALSDYELLELLLFRALPRRDVKPLAKPK
jgi:hypothetical protein